MSQQSSTTINTFSADGKTAVSLTPVEAADLPKSLDDVKNKITSMELPSNKDIDSSLKDAKTAISKNEGQLDSKGKTLAEDAKNILDTTRDLIKEKNKGDKLQKLMRDTRASLPSVPTPGDVKSSAQDLAKNIPANKLKGDAQAIAEDTQELYNYIRKFTLNFVRSPDFRDLATEWLTFFQSMGVEAVEDAVEEGAEKVKETGDKVKKQGGKKAKQVGKKAKEYVDDAADKVRDAADKAAQKAKDNIPSKKQVEEKVEEGAEKVKDAASKAKKEGPKKVDKAADKAEEVVDDAAKKAKKGANKAAEKVKENVPSKGEMKEKVDKGAEKVKEGADKVKDKVKEGGKKAKDQAAHQESYAEAVKEGAQKAEKGAEKASDKVKEGADKAKEKVKENLPETKDVKKKADQGAEKVKEGADKAKEKAKDVKETGKEKAKEGIKQGADKAEELADKAEKTIKKNIPDTEAVKDAVDKGKEKVKDAADKVKEATGSSSKDAGDKAKQAVKDGVDKVQDLAESAKNTVKKNLPDVDEPLSKDELIARSQEKFDDFVNRIASNKEYQKTIKDFFKLYDRLKSSLWDIKENIQDQAEEKTSEATQKLQEVMDNAYDLVGEFTGKTELDNLRTEFQNLYTAIRDDEELSDWFGDLREYLLDVISRPDSIKSSKRQAEAKELVENGRELLSTDRYRDQFNQLSESANALLENLKNDSTTNELREQITTLLSDFALNENGVPDLAVISQSIGQLKAFMIPLFRKQLATIPFKRVEVLSESYDIKLEDIMIVGGGLFPERMDFLLRSYNHLDFTNGSNDRTHYQLDLSIDRIRPIFKNVKFWYHKKSFPAIEDNGVTDIDFSGGEGISLKASWTIDMKENLPARAVLAEMKCNIDSMDIDINGDKTKHNILDTIMAPLVSGIIKTKIANAIEDALRSQIDDVNRVLNGFFSARPIDSLKGQANEAMQMAFSQLQQGGSDALSKMQTQGTEAFTKLQEGADNLVQKVNTQLPTNAQLPSSSD